MKKNDNYKYTTKNGSFEIVNGILKKNEVIDALGLGADMLKALKEYKDIEKNKIERSKKIDIILKSYI